MKDKKTTIIHLIVAFCRLMENTRVRRAGFCFRLRYDKFVNRYKVLSPDLWPNPKHADMLANSVLILKQQGIHETEYKFGKTKLFIKNANSVFKLENPRTLMKHKMATKIRAAWLRYADRSIFLRVRELVIKVQAVWKGYRQLRIYQAERIAATVFSKNFKAVQVRLRDFIFCHRHFSFIQSRSDEGI